MRKYLLNFGVISSLLGGISVLRNTFAGPKNIRLIFTWLAWLAAVGLAIITVKEQLEETD